MSAPAYFAALLLAYGAFLAFALLIYQLFSLSPEESVAAGTMSIMLLVFCAGLLGNAAFAFYLILACAAAGFLFYALHPGAKGKGALSLRRAAKPGGYGAFFSPGVLLLTALVLLAACSFYGTCFYNWDEFAHWGRAVRYMLATNRLPAEADFDGYSYMQSCTTYFHYFVGRITGFDEASLYVSNALLWGAALLLPVSGAGKKSAGRVFLYGLVVYLAMYALYEIPYYNLYTEQAVALWSGALIAYLMRFGYGKKRLLLCGLCLVCVGMMKPQAGILLAVICALAALFMWLFSRRADAADRAADAARRTGKKTGAQQKTSASAPRIALYALLGVLVVASPFLLNALWHRVAPSGGIFISLSGVLARLADRERVWDTFYACYNKLFGPVASHKSVSYVSAFVASAALLYLGRSALAKGACRSRFTAAGALYLVGFPLYFLVTLLTYIVILPESDGINAVSLERYLSLYLMLGLPPLIAPFFLRAPELPVSQDGTRVCRAAALLLALVFAFGIDANFLYRATALQRWQDPYYRMYMQVRAGAEWVDELVPAGEVVYYINQESDSGTVAAEYALRGRWSRDMGGYRFSADEQAASSTTGLSAYPVGELSEKLLALGARYLWVDKTDAYLTASFAELFDVPALVSGDFFRVSADNGRVTLTLVQNLEELGLDARAVEREY